jgi:hypothetical protein
VTMFVFRKSVLSSFLPLTQTPSPSPSRLCIFAIILTPIRQNFETTFPLLHVTGC